MLSSLLLAFALVIPQALPQQASAQSQVATTLPSAVAEQAQGSLAATYEPSILFCFPNEGEQESMAFIIGTNFDLGAFPMFGLIPSIPLYVFTTPKIPLIGKFSLMVTVVPWTLWPGKVDLKINYLGRFTNAVDFTIL